MTVRNRRFLLRERPSGRIGPDTFELDEQELAEIDDGQALVRTEWISLDPTNRAWINDAPTYLPPVGIGETMRGLGLGRIVESKNPSYAAGQLVQGLVGWQEWFIASDAAPLQPVPDIPGVTPSAFLGVLGMTGLTAWVGIKISAARKRARPSSFPRPRARSVPSPDRSQSWRALGSSELQAGRRSAPFSPTGWGSMRPSTTRPQDGVTNWSPPLPTSSMSTSRTSVGRSWRRSSRV